MAGKTPLTNGLPPEAFHYLSLSGQLECPGHNDAEEFGNTSSALLSCGLSQADLDQMWACLAGMMFLGNVKFGDGDIAAIDATGATDAVSSCRRGVGGDRARSRWG